jgi:hypothetical protein
MSYAQERDAADVLKPTVSIEAVAGVTAVDTEEDTTKNNAGAQDGPKYDAWGARRSFALAAGEVIFINQVVWAYNEYIRGANFTQVNPRSWYENIKNGWEYDDNHFNNNNFAHPYHGSTYFNSGRSNGYGYWPSLGFAMAGSFMWECCGETHPPAINDWINTGIGGSVIGEMLYRVGSTVLDNESTGTERILREGGNFLLNPVRGVNRLFSGRAGEVGPNPEERRPDRLANTLTAGARVIESKTTSSDGEFFEESDYTGFFEVDYSYGDGWLPRRQNAFEYFIFNLQVNFGDKQSIGRLQIRGNLYSKPLKTSEKVDHTFAVLQNFDYVNNNAVEFGGQAFSAAVLSRWQLSNKLQLRTQVDVTALLLGAVNSEYAFVAELPDRERLREYDYGPGLGGRASGLLFLNGRQIAALHYRMQWIHTLNGSVVNFEDGSGSSDADHIIQTLALRGRVPISSTFGIGADAVFYVRDSFFTFELFDDIQQRVPQVRLYGTWDIVY